MTKPSPANLMPQATPPLGEAVSYGDRAAMLYEHPESTISLDVAPSGPDFLIQTIDRDDRLHNFFGVPGLGIIDTTRSRAEGELHWAAVFNPNSPDGDAHMYSVSIAGPNPDGSSTQWRPFNHPAGGLSQEHLGYPDNTGYRVRRIVVDDSSNARGDRPSRGATDPFQRVKEALSAVPGTQDTLDRWGRIRKIYPNMRIVGQTALIKAAAARNGVEETEIAKRIRTGGGFY